MNTFEAKLYDGMLPVPSKPGYRGYYPVTNREEWEALPELYKVMEWETVKDPYDKNKPKAVKSVIFDVPYMEPYKISAKVAVHPEEVQKILFCSFKDADFHLYSVCGIELEGGTQLSAKWLQDSISGAFGIVSRGQTVAKQGGFCGFVPECIKRLDDGTFKYNYNYASELRTHYSFSNPFPNSDMNKIDSSSNQEIQSADNEPNVVEQDNLTPYRVAITETYVREVEIYAEDNFAAEEHAENLCNKGIINLDFEDFIERNTECRGIARTTDLELHQVFRDGEDEPIKILKKPSLADQIRSAESKGTHSEYITSPKYER